MWYNTINILERGYGYMKDQYTAHIKIQTCQSHSRNVAKYTANNLKDIGLEKTGYLCGLIHDCGKYTDEFKEYITKSANGEKVHRGEIIHSFAGVRLMMERYHRTWNKSYVDKTGGYASYTSEIIAIAVGEHHGIFDCFDENKKSALEHRMKKQPEYDREAIENFLKSTSNEEEIDSLFEQSVLEIKAVIEKCYSICNNDTENQLQLDELRF